MCVCVCVCAPPVQYPCMLNSQIREWRERKIKAFFHVDKHDEDVQRLKQQRTDSKESSEPAR